MWCGTITNKYKNIERCVNMIAYDSEYMKSPDAQVELDLLTDFLSSLTLGCWRTSSDPLQERGLVTSLKRNLNSLRTFIK